MRLKLTLTRTSNHRMLPMDYQYYISAWVYKVLKQADEDFAHFLHQNGYGEENGKLYKLFCFSQLNFGKPNMWKEKKLFEISAREAVLKVSFDVNEAANNFVKGLFLQQTFYLGDKSNGIDFQVTKIETLPEPDFKETMGYRLKTPWVVSYKNEGQRHATYLKPEDESFNYLSVKHLTEKFEIIRGKTISMEEVVFGPNEKYKRSGFVIKKGSEYESRVLGNIFDFTLKAPVELHRMIWNAGVGEKSSSGFGWVEVTGQV